MPEIMKNVIRNCRAKAGVAAFGSHNGAQYIAGIFGRMPPARFVKK